LRTPLSARVVAETSDAATLIATTASAPAERIDALRRAGVDVVVQPHRDAPVDLRALMMELGRRGLLQVLVEGGGTVNAAMLAEDLADRVIALVAPRLLGGGAPTPVDGAGLGNGGLRLRDVQVRRLGEDVAIEGYLEA
jgi:diaminohydroxyphosphoribosylaminopyrimidine deaminase/5-amino-6-(5-phosphoribosylamino)uracil reductase